MAALPVQCGSVLRAHAADGSRQRVRQARISHVPSQAASLPSQCGALSGSPVAAAIASSGRRRQNGARSVREWETRASSTVSPVKSSPGESVAAFWKFLRPHTIRGTILGTSAVVARALMSSPELINWGLVPRACLGLLALLCGNGYIVGINQVYDVDIDKVNKPFLPVASGEMSMKFAWIAVVALAVLGGTIVSQNFGPLITSLYTFGLFLGTVYSVPPLRLKRFPLLAFLIIATVRGFLLNFGVYYATRAALGVPFMWDPPITFITSFVTVFAMVIAVTKDLPDVKGDQKFNIQTFATELGVQKISLFAIGALFVNYSVAVYLGVAYPSVYNTLIMSGGHAALGAALLVQAASLHSAKYSSEAILGFYRFIWSLFYLEYAMFPFI